MQGQKRQLFQEDLNHEELVLDFLQDLSARPQDKPFLKALYHLVKLLSLYRDSKYLLTLDHMNLDFIDWSWQGEELSFAVVNAENQKDYYFLTSLVKTLHPTQMGKLWGFFLKAYTKRGLLGLIYFTPPPSITAGRKEVGLNGHTRSKDGLNHLRGKFINSFLWASRTLAFGNFRASRGLKVLYHSTFAREVYSMLYEKTKKHYTAIETTTLYSHYSSVFRNLNPLRIYHSITGGWSDAMFPHWASDGEVLYTSRNERKRQIIQSFNLRKGYYFITPYYNFREVFEEFLQNPTLQEPPLHSLKQSLSLLKFSNDGYERELYRQQLLLEKQILNSFRQGFNYLALDKAFNLLYSFHLDKNHLRH